MFAAIRHPLDARSAAHAASAASAASAFYGQNLRLPPRALVGHLSPLLPQPTALHLRVEDGFC